LSDAVSGQQTHHHDVVHFALDEVERELANGNEGGVRQRFRDHLQEIRDHRVDL
jgi:hypothetical protein